MRLVGEKIYPVLLPDGDDLKRRVHREFLGMQIAYVLRDGAGYVPIDEKMLKHWDMKEDRMHEIALINLAKDKPQLIPLKDDLSDAATVYVLTNENGMYGANMLLNTDFLDRILMPGQMYYIYAPSIHDCVLIPDDGRNVKAFTDMLKSIGETDLDPEERLSEALFCYEKKTHALRVADLTHTDHEIQTIPKINPDLEISIA